MDKYFISNEAWQYYQTSSPPRKVGLFITELSKQTFIDTRPDEYKQADEIRTKRGLLPLWLEPYQRYPRTIKLNAESLIRLVIITTQFKLWSYHEHPVSTGAYQRRQPKALASYALEAIGLKYLTPVHTPDRPAYTSSTLYQKEHRKGYVVRGKEIYF